MTTYIDELVQKISTKADLKGFDELDKKQKRAVKQNNLLARSFRNAFGMFLGIQGIRSILEVSREFDLMQKSIKGLTKSSDDFKYLRNEAYRTGSDLLKIASSYKNFYSAASGVGFGKGAIQGMFSDVLTAGRGIGASQEQLKSALVALEQMLSKGKVSAQELRLQMGNALPGAFEIAARAMNMTTAQLDEMMSKGQLASTVFLPKFTAQLKKELGQGFETNIKSLDFAIVNLSNAWKEFQAEILQGESGQALADLIREMTGLLRSQSLLTAVRLLGKMLSFIVRNLKWILMFWGANKLLQIGSLIAKIKWQILDLATATTKAGVASQMMAEGFLMLGGTRTIAGIKMLTAGLWAMVAPVLVLSAKIALLLSAILMIQDLWLTLTDPEAETYSRDLNRKLKREVEPKHPKPSQMIFANPSTYAPQFQVRDEDTLPYKFNQWKESHFGGNNGTYSSSNNTNQNNQISINVYPQQGQNEVAIADAVALKLGNILDNYVMVS